MTTFTWTADVSADWTTASDWSPSGPPSTGDTALITATGTAYTITIGATETETITSAIVSAVSATVDVLGTLNASGSLAVANGTVTVTNAGTAAIGSGGIAIGTSSGSSGTIVVTGAKSTLSDTGGMNDGKNGQGLLDILNGGTVVMTGSNGVTAGASSGSNGTVLVSGTDSGTGVGALLEIATGSKGLTVGALSQGTVTVSAGGTIEMLGTGGIAIGQSLGGVGVLTVTGATSLINEGTAGKGVSVGQVGAGTMEVLSGGMVTIAADGLVLGTTSTGTGTVLVSGTGSTIDILGSTGTISVGDPGSGALTINSGGNVSATSSLAIAGFAPSSGGTVTVDAGTLNAAGLLIGANGTGTLTVQDGGLVTNTNTTSNLSIGSFNNGSSGTLIVNNGTFNDNGAGLFAGGTNASGAILIEGGGSLITGSATNGFADISASGTGTAAAVVNDGTWISHGSLIVGDAGTGSLTITTDGLVNVGTQSVEIGNQTASEGIVSVTGGTLDAGALNLAQFSGSAGTLMVNASGVVSATSFAIGSGGTVEMAGGTLSSTNIATVDGLLEGFGTLALTPNLMVSSAEILSSGGTLVLTGSVSGNGTLDLGSGSTMVLEAPQGSSPTVTFGTGSTETLILATPSINVGGGLNSFTAMTGIAIGDRIEFGDNTLVNSVSVINNGSIETAVVAVNQNGTTGSITFNNVQFTGGAGAFVIGTDGTTGNAYIQASAPCFAAGTRIATVHGEIPVEDLRVGDTVLAVLGDDAEPIIWIGRRQVDCARHPRPQQVWPVRISAGAFGAGLPYIDLMLSPDHAVYINDVLIPVKHLINGSTIEQIKVDRIAYYHIELPRHDIVLAHGLSVESFLDMKDRSNYANGDGPMKLYPDFSSRMWEAFGCAPLVVSGPELASARELVSTYANRDAGVA
jgi:T5SS/PEP-CTERM-associated repeat protein